MKVTHYVLKLSSSSLSLCLQVLYNSVLLFRVAPSGENIMRYFSFKQSWQTFVTGLKTLPLANCFHVILYAEFSRLSFQTYLLNIVAVSEILKSDMCLLYRFLNVPPVSPVYVSTWPVSVTVTVAWYTSSLVWHFPSRGQVAGPLLQLQPGSVSCSSPCFET